MNDDEQNNSNEKPNPLAGGAKRRKPFTRMIDVSDQFMYETFEVGADLSGDELQIQPSNLDARPEEPSEVTQSSSGLSSLLGSGAHDSLNDEQKESPQVTTFSSLLQATGEFVKPTKIDKEPLDPASPQDGFGRSDVNTFGSLPGGAEAETAQPDPAQSFSPPPAFGLPPAQPPQQNAPLYTPRPGQSPLPVLPKYVPNQKSSAPAPAASPQQSVQPSAPPKAAPLQPVQPAQPPQPKPVQQATPQRPASPPPPFQSAPPQPQQTAQQPQARPVSQAQQFPPQQPVQPAAQRRPSDQAPPSSALPAKPSSAAPPRVASSLTPGLGFEAPANPLLGRLNEVEPSQSLPAQNPAPSFSHQNMPAQEVPLANVPLQEEPYREAPVPESFQGAPSQEARVGEPPQPPVPPHSGRPPEPQQRSSGLMGSLQGKSGLGFGRSQSPFAPPGSEANQPQPVQQIPSPSDASADLDDLIFNSDEPTEPPTSHQTTLSARHRTVRRADFTRPRIPQLDPQDWDVVAASQAPNVEHREESAIKAQSKVGRPGRPKPKRGFGKRFSDFLGQIGSAFRKLFKDED